MHTKIFILPSVPAVRFLKVGQTRIFANFAALSKPAGVPGDTVPHELGNPGPGSARPGQIVLAFIVWLLVVHKLKRALPVFKQFYQTIYSIQLSTSFPWWMAIYYVPLRGGTGLPAGTGPSFRLP